MIKHAAFAALVATTVIASGCASVPMAGVEQDTQAKTFAVKPDRANIYVYRNETMGAAIKMPVLMDGKSVGDTGAHTYILQEVNPGKHTVVSKTENDATLDVVAEPGKNYFVWQEVKMGMWAAGSALHLVDEPKGKAGVTESKLVASPQ